MLVSHILCVQSDFSFDSNSEFMRENVVNFYPLLFFLHWLIYSSSRYLRAEIGIYRSVIESLGSINNAVTSRFSAVKTQHCVYCALFKIRKRGTGAS